MVISAKIPGLMVPHRTGLWIRRVLLLALSGIFFQSTSHDLIGGEEGSGLEEGWDLAAHLLINDSYETFSKIKPSTSADPRLVKFGRAATLINVQPKTSGNIRAAEKLLQEIIRINSADDVAIFSQYLLARIAQTHLLPANEPLAIERYTGLIESHPKHPLGQSALAKRALLRIFSLSSPDSLEVRYQSALRDSSLVFEPSARRDYMLLLAQNAILLKLPPSTVLGHLLEAEAAGNFRERALADLYVKIGSFADEAGRKELAITYFEKFLKRFTRDNRRFLVKEKLAALRAGKVSS